jgi:exoribonuclease-2
MRVEIVVGCLNLTEQSCMCHAPPLQALFDSRPADPDAASRVDLTHLSVYTIDDASTRDVDDGISVEQADDGQLLLWVHVADPTRWLQPGAVLVDRVT